MRGVEVGGLGPSLDLDPLELALGDELVERPTRPV
jgi:hypothetical protein